MSCHLEQKPKLNKPDILHPFEMKAATKIFKLDSTITITTYLLIFRGSREINAVQFCTVCSCPKQFRMK